MLKKLIAHINNSTGAHYAAGMLVIAVCFSNYAMTASDKEKYEKKGLSQIEWEMVMDARMSDQKVDELLKAGISITEYFRYPWLKFGISEQEWIKSRRNGLLDCDIAADMKPRGNDGAQVISAFLLPGFHQFRKHEYLKGAIMTGAASISAIVLAARSVSDRAFVAPPLLVLVPSMLWSSLDIGFQMQRERNPDAQRFSDAGADQNYNMSISLVVRSR